MAGNATFESATAGSAELGFSGSYLNGQRGARSAGTGVGLDRLGNRMFGSAFGGGRGGNGSGVGSSVGVGSDEGRALSRCLSLEPIVIGDRVGLCDEFRKVTGIACGNLAEENVKPLPPLADMKDLKRFRSSVEDTRVKARYFLFFGLLYINVRVGTSLRPFSSYLFPTIILICLNTQCILQCISRISLSFS